MSKDDRDDEEFCHECAQCGVFEDCTEAEWTACEGKGSDWFCSQDCADTCEDERQQEREDEGRREDERERGRDDPSDDR